MFPDLGGVYDGCEHNFEGFDLLTVDLSDPPCDPLRELIRLVPSGSLSPNVALYEGHERAAAHEETGGDDA